MKKYTFYVGANNETGKVEKDKLVETLGQFFSGFTILPSLGLWEGAEEESVVVSLFTDKGREEVVSAAEGVRVALNQTAVLVEMPDGEGYMVEATA